MAQLPIIQTPNTQGSTEVAENDSNRRNTTDAAPGVRQVVAQRELVLQGQWLFRDRRHRADVIKVTGDRASYWGTV